MSACGDRVVVATSTRRILARAHPQSAPIPTRTHPPLAAAAPGLSIPSIPSKPSTAAKKPTALVTAIRLGQRRSPHWDPLICATSTGVRRPQPGGAGAGSGEPSEVPGEKTQQSLLGHNAPAAPLRKHHRSCGPSLFAVSRAAPLSFSARVEFHASYHTSKLTRTTNSPPLPLQTRTVCCFPDGQGFAVGSVEGRVAMEYFEAGEEAQARSRAAARQQQQLSSVIGLFSSASSRLPH